MMSSKREIRRSVVIEVISGFEKCAATLIDGVREIGEVIAESV